MAGENAEFNGFAKKLELQSEIPEDAQFDLVVANILAKPLIELAPKIAGAVAPKGRLLISGILGTQADELAEAYAPFGFSRDVVEHQEEWCRLELVGG